MLYSVGQKGRTVLDRPNDAGILALEALAPTVDGVYSGTPPTQQQIDAATIQSQRKRISDLERNVQNNEKRRQDALDYIWREAVPLLDDATMTRNRLRRELWLIVLKARSGYGSHFGRNESG